MEGIAGIERNFDIKLKSEMGTDEKMRLLWPILVHSNDEKLWCPVKQNNYKQT